MLFSKQLHLLLLLALICMSSVRRSNGARLSQDEVDVLNQIARTLGATDMNFDANDACGRNVTPAVQRDPRMNITCGICTNQSCHITGLVFTRYNLPGELPPELARLPYIRRIDLAYNYLNGTIPREWASTRLEFISVFANRLSGNIPSYFGNMSSLRYLINSNGDNAENRGPGTPQLLMDLGVNQFHGEIPPELGNLVNLETLRLSFNNLTGGLPMELSELKNLSDFRINDNNFTGSIPGLFQNWKKLERLEIQGSGLSGPIPTSISTLERLNNLKISDLSGMNQEFPDLRNLTTLTQIVLKNCNIAGPIPEYIWGLSTLRSLDLSFNHLRGDISSIIPTAGMKLIFLTGNFLSGGIPESILRTGTAVDLSYNNFTQESSNTVACRRRMDPNLNLFRSSSAGNPAGVPCQDDFKCDKYWHSFYVNCGGNDVDINGTRYVGDGAAVAGSAVLSEGVDNWGFSNSGDFRDDDDELNAPSRFLASVSNMPDPFSTARISPLSLTYYRYCLENGSYNIDLHFAEIQFTNDSTYASLGRRMFDIYIQDERVEKDFDIEAEAGGPLRPVTKSYTANVTEGVLLIRFYWGGKGTQAIPFRGVHGPLISAISVDAGFKPRFAGKKSNKAIIVGVLSSCLALSVVAALLCYRYYFSIKIQEDFSQRLDISIGTFTLRQIKAATDDFASSNKIGEGGFGPVFKGQLPDGAIIAVKQLSTKSSQGNREFLNEIGMISCLQHPNLVKLYGCCVEGDQLMLVYEYLENNCLSRVLFGQGNSRIDLNWQTRYRICTGIAKGLAFLHEESRLRIIHRDIKGTNVLLDRDLNPKISDFGLAKLHEEGKTHVSTRVAGTIGYIAPEYALWGYLTYKADVYSFGILALEIVSGKHNTYGAEDEYTCLLEWACSLQQTGNLAALVDDKIGFEFNHEEAERIIRAALLCTNASPALRPNMSEVVGMLEGRVTIPDVVQNGGENNQDMRFKMIRDHSAFMQSQSSLEGTQTQHEQRTKPFSL